MCQSFPPGHMPIPSPYVPYPMSQSQISKVQPIFILFYFKCSLVFWFFWGDSRTIFHFFDVRNLHYEPLANTNASKKKNPMAIEQTKVFPIFKASKRFYQKGINCSLLPAGDPHHSKHWRTWKTIPESSRYL